MAKFTQEQENEIINLYVDEELSSIKIGEKFGCDYRPIVRVLKKNNIPLRWSKTRKYKLNETYFDNIDTPNKAYILGFLYADGNNSPQKGTIHLGLTESDKDTLEKIRLEIGSEKPLEYVDNSKFIINNKYQPKNQYRLLMHSKHMCESLIDKGVIPNKTLQLEFPKWLDSNLYSHFVRGYMDGDGCIYTDWQNDVLKASWSIISTIPFCESVKEIMIDEIGVSDVKLYDISANKENHTTKYLYWGGVHQVAKILQWIYKDADLYMDRKYDKFLEIMSYINKSQVA